MCGKDSLMEQTATMLDRTPAQVHQVGETVIAQQQRYFGDYQRTADDPKYRKIWDKLLPLPARTILDVGCTNGALLVPFLERGWACSGFELCAEPAAEARDRGIDVAEGDVALGLPYPDDAFDVVVAGEIVEHVIDDLAFLRELRRVVAPRGMVVLTTPNLVSLGNRLLMGLGRMPRFAYAEFHYQIYNYDVLARKFKEAGLRIDHASGSYIGISRTFNTKIGSVGEFLGGLLPTLSEHFVIYASPSST